LVLPVQRLLVKVEDILKEGSAKKQPRRMANSRLLPTCRTYPLTQIRPSISALRVWTLLIMIIIIIHLLGLAPAGYLATSASEKKIIIIQLLGLAPAGYLTAPDNGA
jgi:hypothetical protein